LHRITGGSEPRRLPLARHQCLIRNGWGRAACAEYYAANGATCFRRSISCCACRCRGRASRTIRATGRRQLDIDGSKIPYFDQAAWAGIATLNGLPATTMPIGHTDIGLLLGVQIIGGYLQTARRSRLPSGSNVNLAASPLRRCCSVATTVPHN